MTLRTLIWRSLRFHWRSHLGVMIGATIGSAALVGALVVGDSVKVSLKEKALERLGDTGYALTTPDRLFREDLAAELQSTVDALVASPVSITPTLLLQGAAVAIDASARANQVTIIGVDPEAWAKSTDHVSPPIGLGEDTVLLNEPLQRQLTASVGDTLLIRIPRASALSREAVMASREGATVTLRLRVAGIMDPENLGNFSLHNAQVSPKNAFVNLATLQRISGRGQAANALLVAEDQRPRKSHGNATDLQRALDETVRERWQLRDIEHDLNALPGGTMELRSSRIFLDPPVERAALTATPRAQPILTYLANRITLGTNATPYSMVTAAGPPWTPAKVADNEIVLNQWLADDLAAKPGDTVSLLYYDPESGAQLIERTNTFRVHSIVPMLMPWADPTLMPDFPGIEKAETTAEWDTAFPLTYKIRPQDDDYWQAHRGTPKAFITLAAGRRMWGNRFGELTAIRFAAQPNATTGTQGLIAADPRVTLEKDILSRLDPTELGLRFEPVRAQALNAAKGAQDFGGLFIGFSLFLIAAALILMSLLFQFGLEQRSAEVGTLLSLGFTQGRVRWLLLGEGAVLAFVGGVIGVLGGVFYARAMLLGLTTVWKDAVGATTLKFFATAASLGIGLTASTLVATFTIWLALRRQSKRPTIALLNSEMGKGRGEIDRRRQPGQGADRGTMRSRSLICVFTNPATVGSGSLVVAASLVGWALTVGETTNAGVFFGAGALVLLGSLALMSARLQRSTPVGSTPPKTPPAGRSRNSHAMFSTTALALRGLARRRSRSVATAALLACGSFLILSIGVFRLDAHRDATERTAGTGGFALIGESTIPIVQNLNTTSGREFFALDGPQAEGVEVVQFRVLAGDDASCLNLNRAQQPRLMGVSPKALQGRFTFAKVADDLDPHLGWTLLESGTGVVPAIGDLNSILWAMGRKVGDTVDYVDGRGRAFQVRIVAGVANSILQGNLIIDEAAFVERYPGESGYEYFLMDVPTNRSPEVAAALSRALQDYGLEITPAARRLNQFNAVQNTYLGTFQILGGLGLLLGSAGLGIVVLRNVLERRSELAVLIAVGFRKRTVELLVLIEHVGLLGVGLVAGVTAAAVAVIPTLASPGSQLPYATLGLTLFVVLANGLIWTWLATRTALRGNLLKALRNE